MPLFEINKRKREAKEFKATVVKGKKDYKNQKSSATAVSGTMEGKQVNTTKSMFTEYDVGKPKTIKGSPHPKYNEDMSNRITVKDEPMPSYMKKTDLPDAAKVDTSVYDGGWDNKKEEDKKPKQVSSTNNAMQSAQDLLNPTAKLRRTKGY